MGFVEIPPHASIPGRIVTSNLLDPHLQFYSSLSTGATASQAHPSQLRQRCSCCWSHCWSCRPGQSLRHRPLMSSWQAPAFKAKNNATAIVQFFVLTCPPWYENHNLWETSLESLTNAARRDLDRLLQKRFQASSRSINICAAHGPIPLE